MTREEVEDRLRCQGRGDDGFSRETTHFSLAVYAPFITIADELSDKNRPAREGILWCLANRHWPINYNGAATWFLISEPLEAAILRHFLTKADADRCESMRGRAQRENQYYLRVPFDSWLDAFAAVAPLYERDMT